jgi:hypothetical protein
MAQVVEEVDRTDPGCRRHDNCQELATAILMFSAVHAEDPEQYVVLERPGVFAMPLAA